MQFPIYLNGKHHICEHTYNVNTHTNRYSLTKLIDKGDKALIFTEDILEISKIRNY